MEPGEEEEKEAEERVRPIATTPPRRARREESLSHSSSSSSSSGTQECRSSGASLGAAISEVSLGAAIPQETTAAARGMEPWFRLPAEVESSCSSAALDTRLGLSCARQDLSEFPTLEEGLLPSAEASPGAPAPASLLDVQESRFSPCLPLLLSPARDETFLQGSQMDFIPLRGIPDVSGASLERSEPSHVHGSASPRDPAPPSELCASSQHSHPVGPADPGAASQSSLSGERLGSEEGDGDRGTEQEAAVPRSRGQPAHPAPEEMLGKGLEQPWSTAGKDGLSPPGSDGPAAGSELSEKDKESPGLEEASSSGNSSYTTALTKFSERSEGGMQKEKVKVLGSEAGVLEKQEKGKKVPELDLSNNFSDGLRRGHSKNSGAQDVLCAATPEQGKGALEEHGVELEGSEGLRLRAAPGELQGALLDHQQEQPSGRLGREELVPAVAGTGAWAPSQPQGPATDTAPGTEGSPGGAEPAGGRDELTGSDFSIESRHKGTEISPSFSLGGEGSFSVHLPHPNFQSTPGIFLKKAGKAEGRGVLVIPSDLQASPLCSNEETSGKPPAHTPGSLGKQHLSQSAPKETCEHFESLKLESPHPGRIQSFPSLSFMEKVGAWNMSQPEEVPDAVSSSVPAGFPPGRKASSALAMAPSSILSVQKSLRDPQDCAAPSCRETGSLGSLHFPHTEPLPAPRLSRSRSDNTVNVCSRSRAWAGVTPAANSAEALQPPGEKSPALGGLDSTPGGCMTPEVVPGSHGEDVESTARRSSAPDVFVSSVAQLPKKDGSSPADEHKDCDAQENQPLSLNIPTGHNIMDSFGAISLESLDVPVSSGEPQGALGSARGSLVVPRPCPSAGGDTSIPAGAVLETPKKEEFNIEERIPVYLRNLGIEQSPGTILAPFVPRRPLRELEFSPVELRTLKDPLDRLARAPPQARGELLPAFEMSHVSFDSDISTPSVSIPVESEAGSGALSPRELCPSFPGLFGEAPVSQGSVSGPQLEVAAPGPTARGAERSTGSAGAEPGPPRCSSGRESPRLGGTSARDLPADRGPRSSDSSLQEWAAGILSGVENKMESDRGSQTPSVGSESSKGQEGDSLMGSGALRELRELLAQAEELTASCAHPASPTASCRETGESSPVLLRKEDDPKDSRLGKDWIPQLQKRLPWDEAATLRGVRGEGLGINPLGSDPCHLGWGNPLGVGLQRSEGLKGMAQEPRTGKSAGRSEPEGCSSVTTDRNQPALVGLAQSSASSDLSTGTAPELGSPPLLEPLGSIPTVLGGSQSSLSQAGVAGRAGGTRGSDDSSSGDSLSARVRSLLGNPPCSQQPGSAMGTFQSILPAAGAARIQAGSGSSSGDSLAARVRSLLRAGSPGIDASRILRSAEEQERKIRAWVKLKLASQSQESGPDWDEETQQKIERIKAELLPKTRNAAQAKDPWLRGLEAVSEYLRKQEQDPEHFQAPTFPRHRHRQLSRAQELFQSSSRPALPFPRADPLDCSLLQDMEVKPWNGAEGQDMELKPWHGAEVQDRQLKPWNGAEVQDGQLKPWHGAEVQDGQLKPWHGAEVQDGQLKPWHGAEVQDGQLKPWHGAEGQDRQLKPWNGAEVQDMELKPWHGAEVQDMELKPWHGAEGQDRQLKPWHGAEVQDRQLKPWHGAEGQDRQLKPWHGAEGQDKQLKPWHGAEVQDKQLKPWHGAEVQDMELKPWHGAEGQDKQLKPWHGAEGQDRQLKPWHGAEGQDRQLKPWHGAELQDMELKPWHGAELQDKQLKPWHGAELQDMELKPWHGAQVQDKQLKPWHGAEGQDRQLKPWHGAEGQDRQLKPWRGAEGQDRQLKPWHGAEGQDKQLKPWRGAELCVCSQRPAVGRPGAVAELRAALEWGPGAGSSAAAPAAHGELPLPAAGLGQGWEQPSASLTLCPPRRPPAPLGALARSPSLPRDGLEGILPVGPLSAGAGEERHSSEPWERSQSCPPSPALAGTGGAGAGDAAELPPVSADSAGARARQETACAAQDPGKRQTLSAKHLDFVTAEVTEGDRQSARHRGLNSSTGASQEINPLIEPRSPSSSQQEKIPPDHTQLCESSEGSDAAAQMGLLKGHGGVLAEERKSPGEPRPIPKEAAREQMGPSQPLPAHEALSTMSETPPSPVRKFLSCVHITLSSRVRNSELRSTGNAGNGMEVWDKPQGRAQAVTLKAAPEASVESVPEFPPAEGVPEDPSSAVPAASADPSRVFSSRQELLLQGRARAQLRGDSGAPGATGIPSSTLPAKPGRRTSDAATQITTESPTKTIFSAEVCVDPQEGGNAAQQPSLPKAPEPPSITTSSHKEIPPFPRQPAQPLLLPYKPSGSSAMYYVPYQKPGVSPGESEASGDSSRSGSEDAPPPGLLARVLALRDGRPPGRAAAQQRGASHSHRARPKLAWAEEQRMPLECSSEVMDRSKAVKPSQSVPGSSRLSLPRPMPTSDSCCLDSRDFCRDAPGAGHAPPSSGAALARAQQHQWGSCVPLRRGGEREFFALTAEADESRIEDLGASASSLGKEAAGMELHQEAAGSDPLPRAQTTVLDENVGKAPRQRSHSRGSLDELWVKFLERRSRHQQQDFGNNGELSLVERLDRLARVLQNPIRHTLALAPAGEKVPEEKVQGREQTETRLAGKARSGSSVEPKGERAGERPRVIHGRNSLEGPGASGPGERRIHHLNRILEEQQYLEASSDTSSETRLSGDPSTCSTSGWDTATQVGLDTPEGSSSLSTSTIDTARLLRAFGQHRLRLAPRLAPKLAPKLSPRLAQLYCAISHQKSRSEDESGAGAAGCPQGAAEGLGKRQQTQSTIPFSSDSTCASSNSWGPSSALSNKRRTRMLNKGIQAGDLEIVSSATRKNTRDVGVTFPTPRSSQQLQEPPGLWQGGRGGAAGAWHQHRVVLPMDRRTKKNRLHFQQGTPWLVPAEDLKCESRKENQCSAIPGPGPAWFEPWSSSKPWREPLREKNWEEQQQHSAGQAAAAHPGAAKGPGQPLGKLTLQEALALHRPDFISRSGQRLRHLRLLQEERRLQGLLQSQQEQLLQPPGKRKDCRSAHHLVSHRGFLRKEKRRTIPKSEMVQRSKRIYEQLPEVRKKREEEQRRLEYGSYRLRAQLYKTKITNRVLGKKVSWS